MRKRGLCDLTSDEEKQMTTDQNSKLKMQKIITFACFFPLLILVFFVAFQTTLTEVQFGPMKLIKDPLQVWWNNPKHLNDWCSCVFESSGEKTLQWNRNTFVKSPYRGEVQYIYEMSIFGRVFQGLALQNLTSACLQLKLFLNFSTILHFAGR